MIADSSMVAAMPLTEDSSTYPTAIYKLTRDDEVDAGEDGEGVSNRQAQELANRTAWLKEKVDELLQKVATLEVAEAKRGFALFVHRESPGELGGSPTGEKVWSVVPIDTKVVDRGNNVALGGSALTVKAGTYRVSASVVLCGVVRGQSRLWDATNGTVLLWGMSVGSTVDVFDDDATYGGLTLTQTSAIEGEILLETDTHIQVQAIFTKNHQFDATFGVNVFGSGAATIPSSEGMTEQYSTLVLERIK